MADLQTRSSQSILNPKLPRDFISTQNFRSTADTFHDPYKPLNTTSDGYPVFTNRSKAQDLGIGANLTENTRYPVITPSVTNDLSYDPVSR